MLPRAPIDRRDRRGPCRAQDRFSRIRGRASERQSPPIRSCCRSPGRDALQRRTQGGPEPRTGPVRPRASKITGAAAPVRRSRRISAKPPVSGGVSARSPPVSPVPSPRGSARAGRPAEPGRVRVSWRNGLAESGGEHRGPGRGEHREPARRVSRAGLGGRGMEVPPGPCRPPEFPDSGRFDLGWEGRAGE